MKPRLLPHLVIISAFSSLLLLALLILNRPGIFVLQLRTPYTETSLVCGQGSFHFVRLHIDYTTPQYMLDAGQSVPPPTPGWHLTPFRPDEESADLYHIRPDWTQPFPAWLPFKLARGAPGKWFSESPPFADGWQFSLRYWFCLPFTLLLPLLWMRRRYRTRHLRQRGFPVMK